MRSPVETRIHLEKLAESRKAPREFRGVCFILRNLKQAAEARSRSGLGAGPEAQASGDQNIMMFVL